MFCASEIMPFRSFIFSCFCMAMLLLWPNSSTAARAQTTPTVREGYTSPQLTVPYAWKKPTLDGIVNDQEWQGALSLNALQTPNKAVSARQTRFWMSWDEDNLYVAMRSPLRAGERLIQALRQRDRDINVVFDDSYEFWLDLGTHSPDGQPVFFQFLSNFAGARYDVMHEPAVGNSRIGWTAGWPVKNHLSADGRNWEMELAVPRASVYKTSPFSNGFSFGALLARNFKRPWEQNSIGGTGSFSVPGSYARFTLSKDAPAVQLVAVANPQKRTFGVQIGAWSKREETLRWQFQSDSGAHREGTLALRAGQRVVTPATLDLDMPGTGGFRIKVLPEVGNAPLLDWSANREFGDLKILDEKLNDTGDRVELALELNPVRNYLRVRGDLIDYEARGAISRYQVVVTDSHNKTLAQKELHLDNLSYVRDVVALPDLPPGDYTARLWASDKKGTTLFTRETKFSKKDPGKSFLWWNTKRGNIEKVLSPWTPVKYVAGRFDVWGRAMRLGDAGLPTQLTTQGANLLARPMFLVAHLSDGTVLRAQAQGSRIVSERDHRVVVQTVSTLGGLRIESLVTVEFDGMYKVEMKLDPQRAQNFRSLQLVVPFVPTRASSLHATGEGIRYGFDTRFLPTHGTGRIWDSRRVDGQPMKVGSFIPYIWIGDTRGGLCWFADSDEGWTPNDRVPAIEVRRDSPASTDLVLNLISSDTKMMTPRRITFAFEATPVKPIFSGWRMDSWWTNDSFQDWAQVESKGGAGDMGLIFSSIPFPLDPTKSREMVEARHRTTNGHIFGFEKYRANAVPYFEHINMGAQFAPELNYFGDEWRTNVSRGLSYGPTLSDFMIYNLSSWVQSCGIDGFYVDNVYPIADDNIEAGRGYRLPDGRVQPTYQMFDTRRYFLRMRAAFAEGGKHNKIVVHMTNNMILPWVGAADIALDGEDHVIYPEMHRDFMDFWSLERMRVDYPAQWGVAVNFLQEYQGDWKPDQLKKAMRAYTSMMLLHDVLMSANANGLNPEVWRAREAFGLGADDVRFIPYWQTGSGLHCATAGVHLAGWKRPGKLLLAVVNQGERTGADVDLGAAKLGFSACLFGLEGD